MIELGLLALRRQEQGGRRHDLRAKQKAVFVNRIEVGVKLIELPLADRVELVIVAPRATERESQNCGSKGIHTIDRVFGLIFERNGPTLVRLAMKAVEAGCKLFIPCCVR